jgi:hypothetical protein
MVIRIASLLLAVALTSGLSAGLPARGQPDASGAGEAAAPVRPVDPVVGEVVRMLEAGVEPEVIARWLGQAETRPGKLVADDLIALKQAGAPEDLVRRILDLVPARVSLPAAPRAPAEASSAAAGGPAATGREAPGSGVPVTFSVEYLPDTDPELGLDPWNLFLYLDGRPLAWTGGGRIITRWTKDSLEFHQPLPPGRRVLRLVQERHEVRSRRQGTWWHETRVSPEAFLLDIEPGADWRVVVQVNERNQGSRSHAGPISFTLLRDGEPVRQVERTGARTDEWPSLCEDVEASLSEKKRHSRAGQRALEGCIRWAALWPEAGEVPTRAEVRGELEGYGYRPPKVIQR